MICLPLLCPELFELYTSSLGRECEGGNNRQAFIGDAKKGAQILSLKIIHRTFSASARLEIKDIQHLLWSLAWHPSHL